jgi:hypothetical protein
MSDRVIIEGLLSSWQSSPLHVGISVNDPTLEGDFAAFSGRRVRVMVEAVAELADRLAGRKCKRCGGALSVHESPFGTYYTVLCSHCRVFGNPQAATPDAAIDAYLAAQKPEPRCPHCGGEIQECHCEYKCVTGKLTDLYEARCWRGCGAHGSGPTRQTALDARAEYLAPCPRCGGKAEYRAQCNEEGTPNGWWRVRCTNDECKIVSPMFLVKAFAGQWWHKRTPHS